jgi:hypothetical protein
VVDRPREPGVAVLEFDSVSSAGEQKPVTVHQANVDPPVRLGVRDSIPVNVNPLQRISIDAAGIGQAGVELTCDGNNAVQVAPVDAANRKLASPINIGSAGIVLPLSGDSRPSELVLYSPDGPATCQAGVKRYGAEPISVGGRRDFAVPQNVQAVAHPINLGADAALVIDDQEGIRPSLTCGSSGIDLAESSGRRVAVVPAHSSCELWLVRSGESTDPTSVSVWVSDVAERQGG